MKRWLGYALLLLAFVVAALSFPQLDFSSARHIDYQGTIRIGWDEHYPYHFRVGEGSLTKRAGLDTELITHAFAQLGYQVEWESGSYAELTAMLAEGKIQALSMTHRTPERQRLYRFSDPYFEQYYSVFYRQGTRRPPSDPAELLAFCGQNGVRVGVTRSYAYPPPIQAVLDEPEVRARVVEAPSDADGLANLQAGRVDLFFCGELVGTSYLVHNHWNESIGRVHLAVPPSPVACMFGKDVPDELISRLDDVMLEMEESGEKAALVRTYFYPSLVSLLTENALFRGITILAAAFAAVSGIFMAYRDRLNLVGAFVLAAAPAAGGGLLRDLIAGRRPIGVVADPLILVVVAFLCLSGYLWFELLERSPGKLHARVASLDLARNPIMVGLDALGMSLYTVIGLVVAMQTRCEPLWLWGPILAATTNGGGSLLRDLIRGEHPIPVLTNFYLQVPIIWGTVLAWFFIWYSCRQPHELSVIVGALGATILGVLMTRLLMVRLEPRRPS